MTKGLKELLRNYGLLTVTLNQFLRERPGTKYETLDEYYKKLGGPLPDEPIMVVRISNDGCYHLLKDGEHNVILNNEEGEKAGIVTVWELPEDEYWFFQAFRPGLFDLENDLPLFIYELAIVHLYAIFEAYLSDVLRARFRMHPRVMGSQRQVKYEQIFEVSSKAELIDAMIEREVRELMYLPFLVLLHKMRDKLGFGALTDQYDERANYISILRNCLLHNGGRVDLKLALAKPDLNKDEKISLTIDDVNKSVNVLRKFAYEIDQSFENKT